MFLGQRLDWKSEGLGTHQRAVQLHDYTGPEPNYTEASVSICALHVYAFKFQGNGNNSRRSLLDNFCRQFTSIVAQYLSLF